MKIYILLFSLINGIIGNVINEPSVPSEPNYGDCKIWSPLVNSTGFNMGTDCCKTKGFECQDSKVVSIDIKVDSGKIDMTKLPLNINLEKYSIKGDIYKGVLPIELLNSEMYKILDLSKSSIKEIPEGINENNSIEKIYLKNNKIEMFPYQFLKLKNLKELYLDDNRINGTLSNFCEFFPNLQILSLKNNDKIEGTKYTEDVQGFCGKTIISPPKIHYNEEGISYLGYFEVFFAAALVIPITVVLCVNKNKPIEEEYLESENESTSQRRHSFDILPDYNDVVKDTQDLPSYEETFDESTEMYQRQY